MEFIFTIKASRILTVLTFTFVGIFFISCVPILETTDDPRSTSIQPTGSENANENTTLPTSQQTPIITPTSSSRLLPTNTPTEVITSTSSNTPTPTASATHTFTPTPLVDVAEASSKLTENGFVVKDLKTSNTSLEVILEMVKGEAAEDIELVTQPLKRLYRAELNIYTKSKK